MSKIGIITLNGYFNYGNRLQNYALQKTLEKMDNNVETIRLNGLTFKDNIIQILSSIKNELVNRKKIEQRNEREKIFLDFSHKYINETSEEYKIHQDLSKLNDNYDKFIVGSDQVWNPNMNSRSSAYFLQFAEKDKRISYSASFGVTKLDSNLKNNYAHWLSEIPNVSVREMEGSKLVKDLTNKDVDVLVDPTMLLSRNEWLSVSQAAVNKTKNKYLLTYFLGTIPETYQSQINLITNKYGLEIINIGDTNDPVYYQTGPGEFIDYINDATIFCTDSFHGVVFSILLQTPFIVYERIGLESMYSRIRTIIDKFHLQSREYKNISSLENILELDYSPSLEIIASEKKRSIHFLEKVLNNG